MIDKIKTAPTSKLFLQNKFNIAKSEMKIYYSIHFQSTIYTKLRSFQFKINHNILYTNQKLHQQGIVDSPLCGQCNSNNEIENLTHLFVDCDSLKPLWNKIQEDMLPPFGINKLSAKYIILGIIREERTNSIVNHIVLEAKYYIYMYVN